MSAVLNDVLRNFGAFQLVAARWHRNASARALVASRCVIACEYSLDQVTFPSRGYLPILGLRRIFSKVGLRKGCEPFLFYAVEVPAKIHSVLSEKVQSFGETQA